MKIKTYIINHISSKQVGLEKNIILLKDVQIWVNKKMLKILMNKKGSLQYIKGSKFKNWVQKMTGLKEPS